MKRKEREKRKRKKKKEKNRRSNAYLGKTKAKLAEKLDYFIGGGARARELRSFPPSFVTAAAKTDVI